MKSPGNATRRQAGSETMMKRKMTRRRRRRRRMMMRMMAAERQVIDGIFLTDSTSGSLRRQLKLEGYWPALY
jgi:hypothetical protein